MDWSDVLTAALAFFLVVTGIGLGYLLYRMAGLFMSLSRSVDLMTDETVPILSRAQITMDGVNQEIGRVDEIMISAVNATKGTEKAVTAVSRGVTAPVRKLSGVVAGAKEAVATFRSRRAAEAADRDYGRPVPRPPAPPPPPPPTPLKTAPRPAPATPPPAEQPATAVREAAAGAAAAAAEPTPARGWTEQRARRAAAASGAPPPPPPAAPPNVTDQGAGGWAEQRAKRAAAARGGGGGSG